MINAEPLYGTPDAPQIDPKNIIAPSIAISPLADFIKDPQQFTLNHPDLTKYNKPAKVEDTITGSSQQPIDPKQLDQARKSIVAGILNGSSSHVANLSYNKFDTKPVEYDHKLARMYRDKDLGFIPGRDNESLYDANQSWVGDIGRNFLGFGANLGGTAVQGLWQTISTPVAIANWMLKGFDSESFSQIYNNSIATGISDWMDQMQQDTYNYKGVREQELQKNPLLNLIPFYGNGFGDAMRSLGYGIGSIGSLAAEEALVTAFTGGVGTVPLLAARLSKLVKGIKGTDAILDVAKSVDQIQKVSTAVNKAGTVGKIVDTAFNHPLGIRAITSSFAEATFEALETQKNLELELVEKYKAQTGLEPTQEILAQIKRDTIEAGNARYILNVGLLTISNAIQFDTLFKSFPMAKLFANEAKKVNATLGKQGFETIATQTANQLNDPKWYQRLAQTSKKVGKTVAGKVALSEGAEEFLQGAFDEATSYYAQHKYDGKRETGLVLEAAMHSLKEMATTSEGWNATLQGIIAGTIQGVGQDLIQKRLGKDAASKKPVADILLESLNPLITDQDGNTAYDKVSKIFNINSLGGTSSSKIDQASSMIGAQKQAKKAITEEDQVNFQTAKDDLQFTFLNQFVKTNQTEALEDIINSWKELATTDLQAFKTQFDLSDDITSTQVLESLTSLETKASQLKKIHAKVNFAFPNLFSPKSKEYDLYTNYRDELSNQLYHFERYNERYNDLASQYGEWQHASQFYRYDELESNLKKEKEIVQQFLSTIDETQGLGTVDLQAKVQNEERLKEIDSLLSSINEDLSYDQARDFMIKADRVFGTGNLENSSELDQIMNAIADMNLLRDRARTTLNIYNRLNSKDGFKTFVKEENERFEKYLNKLNADLKEENKKQQKEAAEKLKAENLQLINTNYLTQLNELASATSTDTNALIEELSNSDQPLTDDLVDSFVQTKITEAIAATTPKSPPTPVQTPVDNSQGFFNPFAAGTTLDENGNVQGTEDSQEDSQEEGLFNLLKGEVVQVDEPATPNPLQRYIDDPKLLEGKTIRYKIENVVDNYVVLRHHGTTEVGSNFTIVEIKGGKITEPVNKVLDINNIDLIENTNPTIVTQITTLLTNQSQKAQKQISEKIEDQESIHFGKSKPIQFFQKFFSVNDQQKQVILSNPQDLKISISQYPIKEYENNKPFLETDFVKLRSVMSKHLQKNPNFLYSFALTSELGDVGIFYPLSSIEVTDKTTGKASTLYQLVKEAKEDPKLFDFIQSFVIGDPKELINTVEFEDYLLKEAKAGKTEVPNQFIFNGSKIKLNFNSYYQGVDYVKTPQTEDSLVRLENVFIDRSQSFILNDYNSDRLLFANSTLTDVEVEQAVRKFEHLFEEPETLTKSKLSSFLLFTKDSTNQWIVIPVKTIPLEQDVTNWQEVEKEIQSFRGTTEDLVNLINDKIVWQNNVARGKLQYNNGKVWYVIHSLFGENISKSNPGAHELDSQSIQLQGVIKAETFTVKGLFSDLKQTVDALNKKGEKPLNFEFKDFRFNVNPGELLSAEDLNQMRLPIASPSMFNKVDMDYTPVPVEVTIENELNKKGVMKPSKEKAIKTVIDESTPQEVILPELITSSVSTLSSLTPAQQEEDLQNKIKAEEELKALEQVGKGKTIEEIVKNPENLTSEELNLFFENYPNSKVALKALRPIHKEKATSIYKKLVDQMDSGELSLNQGLINYIAMGQRVDDDISPSLQIDSQSLDFLLTKAKRECKF